MISRPIRVDRAINFPVDKIGPRYSVFPYPKREREGPVMSRFSPEAFQVAYRLGIRLGVREIGGRKRERGKKTDPGDLGGRE